MAVVHVTHRARRRARSPTARSRSRPGASSTPPRRARGRCRSGVASAAPRAGRSAADPARRRARVLARHAVGAPRAHRREPAHRPRRGGARRRPQRLGQVDARVGARAGCSIRARARRASRVGRCARVVGQVGVAFQHARLAAAAADGVRRGDRGVGRVAGRSRGRRCADVGFEPSAIGPRRVDELSGGEARRVVLAARARGAAARARARRAVRRARRAGARAT